jgi:predicted nucleotidyltransferase component of viral defense system
VINDRPSAKQLTIKVANLANEEGLAIRRVRKRVATIALIQLLSNAHRNGQLPAFLVKGGRALEFRFGALARSSRDVDLVIESDRSAILDGVLTVLRDEWSGFRFGLRRAPLEREHSYILEIGADYNNTDWTNFEAELICGPVDSWDDIPVSDLGSLGLEPAHDIPCMTAAEQIAQKLHAVSDPDEDRARDLYDIYLLDTQIERNDAMLFSAAVAEFKRRGTHPWPPYITLREGWKATLSELIATDGLAVTVDEIATAVQSLILRLHGVTMASGYKYLFIVLEALNHIPNILETPISNEQGRLDNLARLTEKEGWRIVHLLPYPSRDQTRVMLAVLEKAVDLPE